MILESVVTVRNDMHSLQNKNRFLHPYRTG